MFLGLFSKKASPGSLSFDHPIPKGHQIFYDGIIAGINFRKDDALKFIAGNNHSILFELDKKNSHDVNAIKIIGISSNKRYFLGFIPKEASSKIAKANIFENISPRLMRTFISNEYYIEIQFNVTGPRSLKKEFDSN